MPVCLIPTGTKFAGHSSLVTSAALLQQDTALRPDFAGLIYGAPFGLQVTIPEKLPPVFMAWAHDDPIATDAAPKFADALKVAGYTPEIHVVMGGHHGYGMRYMHNTCDHWTDEFYWWLDAQGLTQPRH